MKIESKTKWTLQQYNQPNKKQNLEKKKKDEQAMTSKNIRTLKNWFDSFWQNENANLKLLECSVFVLDDAKIRPDAIL